MGTLIAVCRLHSSCGTQVLSAPQHVASHNQGSNQRPLHWKWILNHWKTREVPSRFLLGDSLVLLSLALYFFSQTISPNGLGISLLYFIPSSERV